MTTKTLPAPANGTISEALLEVLIEEHQQVTLPRLSRLWDYYRNPMTRVDGQRGYGLGQAQGLPARLRPAAGRNDAQQSAAPLGEGVGAQKREVVIENDIAWRIHTLVDFMFGRPVVLQSQAGDSQRAAKIEAFLQAVFEVNGGVGFFQDLALLGAVYGTSDVLVHLAEDEHDSALDDISDPRQMAKHIVLEPVEPRRAIAVLNPSDYRKLDGYVLDYVELTHAVRHRPLVDRIRRRLRGRGASGAQRGSVRRTWVWTADAVREYRQASDVHGQAAATRELIGEQLNRLGRIPVVHIQNLAQPFFYEGLSEVEPLIPLQDELNTRLSDRANRVTMQCFKMYLGKGIEHFHDRPIGPGQMWSTDNPDAAIEAFGGDADNPSEQAHIGEIRDAMDKTSGVTAVAAGMLRGKVGNLTSENALRIVLMGLLAKTEKKRVTYGVGIEQLCELILHAANVSGVLPNEPNERGVRLDWPNPLPVSEKAQLQNARMKMDLGVPHEQVMAELGYRGISAV